MLIGTTAVRLEIPHEPGEWMDLRALPWRVLETARLAAVAHWQRTNAEMATAYGVELLKALRDIDLARLKAALAEEQQAAASNGAGVGRAFDLNTLLQKGIAGWSYSPDPPTPAQIDELDERTAGWAAAEIARLSLPPQDADARKKS